MKPIEYFYLFEEAKREFINAREKDDFVKQIESAQKLLSMGHHIAFNNYHSAIKNLFVSETEKNSLVEVQEMYSSAILLIEMMAEGLKIADTYYHSFYDGFVLTTDMLYAMSLIADEKDKKLQKKKEELSSFLKKTNSEILTGVECFVRGMFTPLSYFAGIVQKFSPDHFLMKEEKVRISEN